jgi:hypothetical protein
MNDSCWDELGIAPTADDRAIRRAYAARLKTADTEGDPAAFMRLRQAYEDALADADDDFEPVRLPPAAAAANPVGEGVAAVTEERGELPGDDIAAFDAAFSSALGAVDTRAALAAVKTALAQGVVPLGGESRVLRALVSCGLDESDVSLETLEEMERLAGRGQAPPGSGALAKLWPDLRAKVEALRWLRQIEAAARRGDGRLFPRSDARVARAILGGSLRRLRRRDHAALRKQIAEARRHLFWLEVKLDIDRMDNRLTRRERWWIGLLAAEFMALVGLTHFYGEAWPLVLGLFGVMLITVGSFLRPVGIAFLMVLGWMLVSLYARAG